MNIKKIQEYVVELDERESYRLYAIILGVLIFFLAVIIYFYYHSLGNIERRIKKVNQLREETRTIFAAHEMVKKQQQEVDTILAKDPTFKIKEYFTTVVNELHVEKNMSKNAEISEPQDLNNGYSEIKLEASFSELHMKQLVNLLYKIEQNERIFTKELVIAKALKSPTIDVTLVIATLQPQAT